MLKKLTALLLILVMVLSLSACGGQTSSGATAVVEDTTAADTGSTESTDEGTATTNDNWKIGILTGTVAQNEEEYRAAENVLAKYGDEHVVIKTYPDKFMDEQDTTISNIVELASDPDVKALIIVQAVPGVSAGIEKAKELRDDLLIIAGVPGEDPAMIASKADIVLALDELAMGNTIPEQAKTMGAEVFVHYSFPRHMSYALLSARRDLMKDSCDAIGLKFVDATAPDPTGDAGVPGAQQFILEDVPRKVAEHGKNTAFFSTNCSMQVPLIEAVVDQGAIYPQPCCPSPTHGFPSALAIKIEEENKGDMNYILEAIKVAVAEKGASGRLSTWAVPVSMMFIEGSAEYAKKWMEGKITEKLDFDALKAEFEAYAGTEISMETLTDNGVEYPNYMMILLDFYTF